MKVVLNDRLKVITPIFLIIISILLTANTNNNPVPFMERIFKPINIGLGTFHYSGLLIIVLIYNCIRVLGKNLKGRFSFFTKYPFIITILILLLASNLIPNVTKMVKSFSGGLNSIYCNREAKALRLDFKDEDTVKITSTMELKNYSHEERNFYLKIYIPEKYKNKLSEKEFYALSNDGSKHRIFTLKGKEKRPITAIFIGKPSKDKLGETGHWGSFTKYFEFELINENETIKFFEKPMLIK